MEIYVNQICVYLDVFFLFQNGSYSYDVHIVFLKQIGRNEKYLTWHSEWHTLCTYHWMSWILTKETIQGKKVFMSGNTVYHLYCK